jgi:thiamine-phosphate pyrophosphorylase
MATFLPAVLRGGVTVVQIREKSATRDEISQGATLMQTICREFDVPFIVNDDPTLAYDLGADGVHVGQDDSAVSNCRAILGDKALVGLSTHAPTEFAASLHEAVDYRSAGPIVQTPTKAGRPGTGLSYAVECQNKSHDPVYVTGGVDVDTLPALLQAGLTHFVVVRALTTARDPGDVARRLSDAILARP